MSYGLIRPNDRGNPCRVSKTLKNAKQGGGGRKISWGGTASSSYATGTGVEQYSASTLSRLKAYESPGRLK